VPNYDNSRPVVNANWAKFAVRLARSAGQVLLNYYNAPQKVEHKGAIDLVTAADRTSEELIYSRIKKRFPEHGVLGEEGSASKTDSEWLWVIDPLDGTSNYAHHYPFFCVSIALQHNGVSQLGVIYEPLRKELFQAVRGRGVRLNGISGQVSSTPKLSEAFLSTGFAYDIRESEADNLDNFSRLAKTVFAIRRGGSAALDLAYVACGRFDGFWELKLHPWDTAAGILMVEEAGGKVSRFSGEPFSIIHQDIIATNGLIHQEMMAVLTKGRMEEDL
jgi:myo-inositol-1(or 4)-monophosphatase